MGAKRTWTGAQASDPQGERSKSNTTFAPYLGLNVHTEKNLSRIATRYDQLAEVFLNFILLAASIDWINSF